MRVRQAPSDDVLSRDGETAVLVDGVLVRLSELSSALYALCEAPADVSTLARELEKRFGHPAHGTALLAAQKAVTEMIRHGILVELGTPT